jgi:preprotein translocase subunit SecA
MLASLDMYWTNHLENLEALLESVRMRAYGQKDPLVEYKRESYELFKTLIADTEAWVVSNTFILTEKQVQIQTQNIQHIANSASGQGNDHPRVGRNDPCWCGAKKSDGTPVKYKHCHGK